MYIFNSYIKHVLAKENLLSISRCIKYYTNFQFAVPKQLLIKLLSFKYVIITIDVVSL